MAYDEGLAERIRDIFMDNAQVTEKKMFGGLCFLLSGNMCCGIVGDTLMARVGPDAYADSLQKKYVREMDFTGKPMKGMVYVSADGLASDAILEYWVGICAAFAGSMPPKNSKLRRKAKSKAKGKVK